VTSAHLSVIPDLPAWPINWPGYNRFSHNNPPPWVPALEYRPTEYKGLYIDHLGPFSVESSRCPVGSSTHSGLGHLSNAPVLRGSCTFNEANPRGPSEDVWGPVVRPPAGQVASDHSSGSTGAQVGNHVPGCGIYRMHCIGKSGEEVTFSNGDKNRAQYVVSAPLSFGLSLVIQL